MIKVNTKINQATRDTIPNSLKGLSPETLRNLQVELNPVPVEFLNIEYWPENIIEPVLTDTQKKGAEILTPNIATKQVDVTWVVEAKTQAEIDAEILTAQTLKLAELDTKAQEVRNQGVTVNGVEIDTDERAMGELAAALSLMGRRSTETIGFKAKNGFANVDKTALEALQDAAFNHIKAVNANHKTHYDAINELTTAQAVVDYDFSVGW